MYIKTEDLKQKILDAYVSGESKTHKNAQDYYRKWFPTKVRVVIQPPNQEVTTDQQWRCKACNDLHFCLWDVCQSCGADR
jgi:hypothetical protein